MRVLGSIDRHCVSPALRGDGRVTASKISATTKFPPRYAGMEVNRVGRIGFEFRFPRATRGWKDKRFIKRQIRYVSPALRGDGRISGESDPYSLMFPPRYAGMEGHCGCGAKAHRCFPPLYAGMDGGMRVCRARAR